MKRDMDLVRAILLSLEAREDPDEQIDLDAMMAEVGAKSEGQFMYHIQLLAQAGLLEAIDTSGMVGISWRPLGLTWHGHEFLDAARNDTVWKKTRAYIQEKGGAVPFALVQDILLRYSKEWLGLN